MVSEMILVEDLSKSYGDVPALDHLSFAIAPGTVVGLLGPNGAGKTTLVNCLSTLIRPDSGRARVAGCDVLADPAGVRRSIALTGQFAALDPSLSARRNLILFARLLGMARAAAGTRAVELIDRFDLGEFADRPATTLSGGETRRLDLAISQVVPRPVLFLDEPTTGLDPRSRHAIWDEVRGLRDGGTTVLLTTQYLDEADQLADRVLIVDRGRLIAEGTPRELKDKLGTAVCEIRVPAPAARAAAQRALVDAGYAPVLDDETLRLPADGLGTLRGVVRALDGADIVDAEVNLRPPTLDEVFLTLTGAGIVDTESAAGEPAAGAPTTSAAHR